MQDENSTERWLPVVGYEGLYEVSDQGRVRSLGSTVVDRNGRKWDKGGKVLLPGTGSGGYQVVVLGYSKRKCVRVHTLVLEAFVGPRARPVVARHLDGNPGNNNLNNLLWGTNKENAEDAILHGRTTRGERNRFHKLTSDDVIEICRRWSDGETHTELAVAFNVHKQTIFRVVHNETWKNVHRNVVKLKKVYKQRKKLDNLNAKS